MTRTDGLRNRRASATAGKVCHDANQPNTTSERRMARAKSARTRPRGDRRWTSLTAYRSERISRSWQTKRVGPLCTNAMRKAPLEFVVMVTGLTSTSLGAYGLAQNSVHLDHVDIKAESFLCPRSS